MFIQTEATPNPATLKFIPGQTVLGTATRDFSNQDEAQKSPLATKLFEIDNVSGVFLGSDFISVTKKDGEWHHLKPAILGVIMEHYVSGAPILDDDMVAETQEESFDEADKEIVDTIKDLLDTRVRPAVAQDGGDIMFQSYKDGIVYLKMRGACANCPSSTATLRHGIENLLKHFIPEIQEVRPVDEYAYY